MKEILYHNAEMDRTCISRTCPRICGIRSNGMDSCIAQLPFPDEQGNITKTTVLFEWLSVFIFSLFIDREVAPQILLI